jgi:hypothetical protein
VQTFLPYESFGDSATVLDSKRLGKQRIETLQIMMALTGNGGLRGGWTKHPAARMWHGHLAWLMAYQVAICHEWIDERGFRDTCLEKTRTMLKHDPEAYAQWELIEGGQGELVPLPWFVGHPVTHFSHRASLVTKAPGIYMPLFGPLLGGVEYFWTEEDADRRAAELGSALAQDFSAIPE